MGHGVGIDFVTRVARESDDIIPIQVVAANALSRDYPKGSIEVISLKDWQRRQCAFPTVIKVEHKSFFRDWESHGA